MLRFVNICLVFALVALAYVIYQAKYEAHALDERIVVLHKELETERDALAVLRAEWSLLNRPERIERLAKKYIKLVPPRPQQLVILDEVTERDFQHRGGARKSARPVKSAAVKAAAHSSE